MTGPTPQPGSLVARMLEQGGVSPAPIGARAALGKAPRYVDLAIWVSEHEALAYDLLHQAVKAANDGSSSSAVTQALAQLMKHARMIGETPRPLLVSNKGVELIDHERLVEAQAKVRVLTAEIAELRACTAAPQPSAGEAADWIEEHEWLVFALLHESKALARIRGTVPMAAQRAHDTALRALLGHAQGLTGEQLPWVQGRIGSGTIPYELFAESRAEVRAQRAQVAKLTAKQEGRAR